MPAALTGKAWISCWTNVSGAGVHVYKHVHLPRAAEWRAETEMRSAATRLLPPFMQSSARGWAAPLLALVDVTARLHAVDAKAGAKDQQLADNAHQWKRFLVDLSNVAAWLHEAEAKQARETSAPPDVRGLEQAIRRHRVRFWPRG